MTVGGGWASLGHTSFCLSPAYLSPCRVLGNKSRKNCGLQSRISIAQLFIIASAFPPGALCSAFPLLFSALLCSAMLFTSFFVRYFYTAFWALFPPLAFFPSLLATPVTRDTATFSLLSRLSFHFASSCSSCFYFYSTRAKTFVFVRAFCMSFPPFPSSHILPRLLPLCLPQSFLLPLSLPPCLRPLHLLPFDPRLLFYFVLFVFLFVLFSVSLCFLFSTPSPRDSQIC